MIINGPFPSERKTYNIFIRIRLGEWDVNSDEEFYANREYEVSRIIIHPQYHQGKTQIEE